MILEDLINKHIVIYEYNFGLKFFIKNENNKISILNKFKKPLSIIDKTIYKDYELIEQINISQAPDNSLIKCKISNNRIFLDSIQVNKKFINNTSNQINYANRLNINSKRVLFEGKVNSPTDVDQLLKRNDIAVLTNENLSLLNLSEKKNTEYVQFINLDIVEYFTQNSILYELSESSTEKKYTELICKMFNEWIKHFNDDSILENSFGFGLNTKLIKNRETLKLIESNRNNQLLQLFLTLFYENKNWKGYFYNDSFIDKYNTLKNKLSTKINNKRDLFFIK